MNDRLGLFGDNLDVAPTAVGLALRTHHVRPHEHDDLTQDALVALWKATGTWDGRGTFGGYAVGLARFAVIDGIRKRHGRRGQYDGLPLDVDPADREPGPERVACARAEYAAAAAWLASLDERTAAAVVLPGREWASRYGRDKSRASQLRGSALRERAA